MRRESSYERHCDKEEYMAKKIAVINDLSGFGKCSLTAAIPVISVMGVQPCPLPTAILSAQTAYPSYFLDDYTDKMDNFRREWKKQGVQFDGIYTGFVASEIQIEHIFRFLEAFRGRDTFLLVDPVMGDDGIKYDLFTEGLLGRMKALAAMADVITPNLTELCLLTGEDYRTVLGLFGDMLTETLQQMAHRILRQGPRTVIITGIHFTDHDGEKIGNLIVTRESSNMIAFPYIGRSFSGTGDLFASIIAGGMARGDRIEELCRLAGEFTWRAMQDSVRAGAEDISGTEFERHLGMLLPDKKRDVAKKGEDRSNGNKSIGNQYYH